MADPSPSPPPVSALAPLRHRAFAVLWTATVVGNIGIWMRDVGLAWLMTELDPRPWLVAMVQAAASLPVFLLALPAGALADILDRRRLLFWCQVGLMLLSVALAAITWTGLATPALIVALTLAAGVGTALSNPAWQTIVPQLVPRAELRPAVALNSLGINISRAIGPALGGLVVATAGVAAAFVADALSFVGILAALLWWRPAPRAATGTPPEGFTGAMRAGARYARSSPALRRVLMRALAFFLFASAPWALLPLVARQELGGGAALYGTMLAAVGLGAVAGALAMGWLKRRAGGAERLVLGGTVGMAAGGLALASAPVPAVAVGACGLLGIAWISVLTTLNVAAQSALPDWVRGRGLALYLMTFSGAMAGGSLAWGFVAQGIGVPGALAVAAALALVAGWLVRAASLPAEDASDSLLPDLHMPAHGEAERAVPPGAGPVLVLVDYQVAPERRAAFLAALARLEPVRRRDGAEAWWCLEQPGDPLGIVEAFLFRDWAEHARMHLRAQAGDHALHEATNAFDLRAEGPGVRHLVSVAALAGPPSLRGTT